jgi:hypothetical protein
MFVILFDESQDKDIAGETKNRYYLSPGGFREEPGQVLLEEYVWVI